jgi:hypothetical protein
MVDYDSSLRGNDGFIEVLKGDNLAEHVGNISLLKDGPVLGGGWTIYAYWNNGTGTTISVFKTTWKVPPDPQTTGKQTIFLFNGIQNYGSNFGILQPVLQWGPSAAGGGQYWSAASWYVTSGGLPYTTRESECRPTAHRYHDIDGPFWRPLRLSLRV